MEGKRMTSFVIDKDIAENQDFLDTSRKRGFLKKFLNNALREAFLKEIEVNEEVSVDKTSEWFWKKDGLRQKAPSEMLPFLDLTKPLWMFCLYPSFQKIFKV